MTTGARTLHRDRAGEHILQLFDTPESLGTAVSEFLYEGWEAGERLLVAAKSRNWKSIRDHLERRGCSVPEAIAQQRLTVIDAQTMLTKIMRGSSPDPVCFEQTIGSLVAHLADREPLRIYGELVEVLAEEGNLTGACELESLWNELAARHRFALLCGYSAAHFTSPADVPSLHAICGTHSCIQRSTTDMLAGWLHDRSEAADRNTRDTTK